MINDPLRYAELGYAVFPCVPGEKKPLTKNGLLDATTDGEQVEAWWQAHPNANVAIATQGLVVIDLDVDGAGNPNPWLVDQPELLLDLAKAPMSITPRGGRHYIFKSPHGVRFRNSAGKLAPFVDVRADGGYIVVAPSKLASGNAYRWAEGMALDITPAELPEPPSWLLRMLFGIQQTQPSANERTEQVAGNAIPPGQRNSTLTSLAGTMRRVGMSEQEILAALHRANVDRCKPPMDAAEVEQIAGSVARYEPDTLAVAVAENWAGQDRDAAKERGERPAGPSDPGPFPAKLLEVPGLIAEVVEYNLAGANKLQPELALAGALSLLATLTGRKISDARDTRTNLYILGVCRSGGGKERARQVNKELLYRAGLEKMIGGEGIASHAGLVTAIEQQPAQLMQLDEIGRMLKTLASPGQSPHLYHIATVMMKLFTSANSFYRGDVYADQEKNKTIDQPHLCIYGTTVPKSLYESLTAENVTDGFLSRMLVFEASNQSPDAVDGSPVVQAPQSLVEATQWWGDFRPGGNLNAIHPIPLVVPYEDEARRIVAEFTQQADKEAGADEDGFCVLWTRAAEKARKLALLWACSESREGPRVTPAAARWACGVSDYLTRKMLWTATQWVTGSAFEARRQKVLRSIRMAGPDGISLSHLIGKTRSLTKREREEIVESLTEAGEIAMDKVATGGRSGVFYRTMAE